MKYKFLHIGGDFCLSFYMLIQIFTHLFNQHLLNEHHHYCVLALWVLSRVTYSLALQHSFGVIRKHEKLQHNLVTAILEK